MKVKINFISGEQEENAVLNLHADNRKKDEMAAYLENNGVMKRTLAVTLNGKIVYLSCEEIFYIEAEKTESRFILLTEFITAKADCMNWKSFCRGILSEFPSRLF